MLLPALLGLLAALTPLQDPPQPPDGDEQAAPAETGPHSLLAQVLYLSEEPPDCRSVKIVLIARAGTPGVARSVTRTEEEALELATHVSLMLHAGEDFDELAREYSDVGDPVLGTFPPGSLPPAMEPFVWSAKRSEVSDPIRVVNGYAILQVVDRFAACRHILVSGEREDARERAESLLERARAGEDFAELARETSDDPFTGPVGGALQIFERGPEDRLVKQATFELAIGAVGGPIEASNGYHVIKRVPTTELDPKYHEVTWVRARAILVANEESGLADRSATEAEELAAELHRRIYEEGEDMAELARRHDDDPGGRERAGDLGWLYRGNPAMVRVLDRLMLVKPGDLLEPIPVRAGWLLLRRER
jgi:parvulin-like peptidyl-prolyl isomerase